MTFTSKQKLGISFLLILVSILIPGFMDYRDSGVFILVFTTVFSVYYLKETKIRKWYFILGLLICLFARVLILLINGRLDLLDGSMLLRIVVYYFCFWGVPAIIGYVLTDGLNLKFNLGIQLGLGCLLTFCLIPPLVFEKIESNYLMIALFLIFGFLNGYFSNRKNFSRNFLSFSIPLIILMVFSLIMYQDGWNVKVSLMFLAILGSIIVSNFLGNFMGLKRNKLKLEQNNEVE